MEIDEKQDILDASRLKVKDLRKELEKRGLPTTGVRCDLEKRLNKAIEETFKNDEKNKQKADIPSDIGARLKGWVLRWNPEAEEGVVCDQSTNNEYPVKKEELKTVDYEILRAYDNIEFSLQTDDNGKEYAVCVTQPNGFKIRNVWRHSTRRGQDAPIGSTRYIGFVEKIEQHRGFLIFKTANYKNIYFSVQEIQCTGAKRLWEEAVVEFQVGGKDGKIQAQHITRIGGELITFETGNLGQMLREQNKSIDRKQYPKITAGKRMKGLVASWCSKSESGVIWPDTGEKTVICKAAEIKSAGLKQLRVDSEVEFCLEKHDDGIFCKNLTNPGNKPYIFPGPGPVRDHVSKSSLTFEEKSKLPVNPLKIQKGWIKLVTNNREFGFIEPRTTDCQHVEFTYHQIFWEGPGFPTIPANTEVEFRTCAWDDGTVRALKITAPHGEPFKLSKEKLEENTAFDKKHPQHPPESAEEFPLKLPLLEDPLPRLVAKVPEDRIRGVVVDFHLPSMRGIIQPLADKSGGEQKGLYQFLQKDLQCEGFRAIEKWQTVEFTTGKRDNKAVATFITDESRMLINFDGNVLLQRERWLIEAHNRRLLRRSAKMPANRRQGVYRNWAGTVMPFPIGMPPFPPTAMNPVAFPGGNYGPPFMGPPMMGPGPGYHRGPMMMGPPPPYMGGPMMGGYPWKHHRNY